jgi:DNA-directed RNA polymerase subunit RPC12/RpoP
MKVKYRVYKCRNCGNEQQIQTNHLGSCYNYCKNCSWKPSWGEYIGVPMFGHQYRPFDYVREVEE